jgi:hypothetical protein
VRAAALAGLAITPLPASALIAGLRILGVEEGLPPLPDLDFAIYEKARPDKAATALAAAHRSGDRILVAYHAKGYVTRPAAARESTMRSRWHAKATSSAGLIRIVEGYVAMRMRVLVRAERADKKGSAGDTLGGLHVRIAKWSPVFVKRTGDHIAPIIGVGVTGSFANGHFNCFHRLEDRAVIFPSMKQLPDILANSGMKGLFGNSPKAQNATCIRLSGQSLCPTTELANFVRPHPPRIINKEGLTLEPGPGLSKSLLNFGASIRRILTPVVGIVRPAHDRRNELIRLQLPFLLAPRSEYG